MKTTKKTSNNSNSTNLSDISLDENNCKILVFNVIINKEYMDKMYSPTLNYNNEKIKFSVKKKKIIQFPDISNYSLFGKATLKKFGIIYEANFPLHYKNIKVIFSFENNNNIYAKSFNFDSNDKVIIKIKPLFDNKDNIFYKLASQEEKELYLDNFVIYLKEKDIEWKKKFKNLYSNDCKSINSIKELLSFVSLFDKNYIEINNIFDYINIEKMIKFYKNDNLNLQIIDLFNNLKGYEKKDEISVKIWSFLIISLMKIEYDQFHK